MKYGSDAKERDPKTMDYEKEPKKEEKRSKGRAILLIIALVCLIAGLAYIGMDLYQQYAARQEDARSQSLVTEASDTTGKSKKAANPVDFKKLQSQNDEIYAWIKVDGTEVNYPIVQSTTDDEFYLKHSAYDKSWLASGAVFTQSQNSTTFNDSVTLVYGHNGYSESMFTSLHKFEDKTFFDEHPYFYIYMPGHKLTYQIISAFKYDDRHIMNSFSFQDVTVRSEFFAMLQNPDSTLKNVRTELKTNVDKDSKIVILSTCFTGSSQRSSRYLVSGVLLKNEETD